MLGANAPDISNFGEWPSVVSRDVYGPKLPSAPPSLVSDRTHAARYERPEAQQDQTPFAVPSPQPSRIQAHDEADDIDLSAHEAVLLSPGAELRSSAKVGLGLVVLASALLGVFVLQRSQGSLRSLPLPSVHSAPAGVLADPPADGDAPAQPAPEVEQSTQAATAYTDSLPAPTAPAAALQRAAAPEPQVLGSSSHARAADVPRHAALAPHAEPGLEASVEVTIRTIPRGASVAVLGTDARCEPTPCALLVPKDRAVTLRAEARNTSVQKTFTFGEESEVELRLSGRNTSTKAAPESAVTTKPVAPPHAPSDLKVPSIFR